MERLLGRVVTMLCFCMFLAATVHGKQLKTVYLKDGGIIECQSFWKENGKVMVLVNRDVLVDLSPNEVNMKQTFEGRKRIKVRKPAAGMREGAKPAANRAGVLPAAAPKSGQAGQAKMAGAPGARQKAMTSAAKPAAGAIVKPTGRGAGDAGKLSPAPGPANRAPVSTRAPIPAVKPRVPVPSVTPGSSALAGMFGMGMLLPFLLLLVLIIASFWKVFTKAGEAGWQSIIPLYNMYVLVKISGKPWWWFLLLFVPLVNIIIAILVQIALAERFDKGALFGLGLAFLGFIFYPLLAFDKSTYR
jgi:hypothetical protein